MRPAFHAVMEEHEPEGFLVEPDLFAGPVAIGSGIDKTKTGLFYFPYRNKGPCMR